MDDYVRGGHTKYSMTVHIILVTKYRKRLFFYEIKEDIKQFLFDATANMDVTIVEIETDQDHIHMLIKYKPSMAISDIVS